MIFVYILAAIVALTFTISGAILLTIWFVKKSNDIGDSKGHFDDFAESFHVLSHKSGLPNTYTE